MSDYGVSRQSKIYAKWRRIAARNGRILPHRAPHFNRVRLVQQGTERHRRITLPGSPDGYGQVYTEFIRDDIWTVQKKPYKGKPLPYNSTKRWVGSVTGYGLPVQKVDVSHSAYDDSLRIQQVSPLAYNKAYGKFVDQLGESSLWLTNYHERGQSIAMIVFRATQLARFAHKINRFDVPGAWKELGLGKPSTGSIRRSLKGIANAFLEVHFGWVPLVKDIEAAFNLLISDPPFKAIVGKSTSTDHSVTRTVTTNYPGPEVVTQIVTSDVRCSVRIAADVRVTNANAFLASRLGLVNPASFVWEAIPYSFVLDWFSNVGQVLNSWNDFMGVALDNPCVTYLNKTDRTESTASVGNPFYGTYGRKLDLHEVDMKRTTGAIPGPTLRITPFHGLSVTHGATAIALLLQRLKGG